MDESGELGGDRTSERKSTNGVGGGRRIKSGTIFELKQAPRCNVDNVDTQSTFAAAHSRLRSSIRRMRYSAFYTSADSPLKRILNEQLTHLQQ